MTLYPRSGGEICGGEPILYSTKTNFCYFLEYSLVIFSFVHLDYLSVRESLILTRAMLMGSNWFI